MNPIRFTAAAEPASLPARAPIRILVVDDLPEICAIFKDIHRRVRAMPTELVTETNSARALALVQRQRFDLVVSDYRMREVDGIEVLRGSRATNPDGHRILMTGYNEIPTTIARIRDANVDAYVQKPLQAQELLLLLLGFLQQNEAAIQEHRMHARKLEAQAEAGAAIEG